MAEVEKLVHRMWEKLVLVASVILVILVVVFGFTGIFHLFGIDLPTNGRIMEGLLVTVIGLSLGYACITDNHTHSEVAVRNVSDRTRHLLRGWIALLGAIIWGLAACAAAGNVPAGAFSASVCSHPINRGVWAVFLCLIATVLLIRCAVSFGKRFRK